MKSHGSFPLALVYSLVIHLGLLLIFSPLIAAWLQPITPPQLLEVMEIEPQDLSPSEETESAPASPETNLPSNDAADAATPPTTTPLNPTPQPPVPPKKDSNKKTAKFLKLGQLEKTAIDAPPAVKESFDPEVSDELRREYPKVHITLWLSITESGTVNLVQLESSTGNTTLDQAIETALKRWTFQPATLLKTGQPRAWNHEVSLDLDFTHPLNPSQ